MVDIYATGTPENTPAPSTPASGDRFLDSNSNEFLKTSTAKTVTENFPLAVFSNTVGAASSLTVGTTPTILVKSFNATSIRLGSVWRVPQDFDLSVDPVFNVHQVLASNYASDTRLQWQLDYRVVTPASNGRLVTGTNTTLVGSSNSGASATNGANSVTRVPLTIDADLAANTLAKGSLVYFELSCDELQVPRYFFSHADIQYRSIRKD